MAQTFHEVDIVEVTPSTANSWTDVDVSSYIPSGATGVILHYECASTNAFGLRKNGSTDNRTNTFYSNQHTWAAIGIDGNRVFEAYVGSTTDISIYLVGYTTSGVTFLTNGIDKSLSSTASWTDIDCSDNAPNAIGLIFEQLDSLYYAFGLRKNGSTDTIIKYEFYHSFHIIGCDVSQICEGYIQNTSVDFYLVGYITDGAVFNTNATDISLSKADIYIDIELPNNSVMGIIEIAGAGYPYNLRKNGSDDNIYRQSRLHCLGIVACDGDYLIEGRIAVNTNTDFYLVGYATGDTGGIGMGIAGSVTLAGNLSKVLNIPHSISGSVSSSGGTNRTTTKAFAGTVTPSGVLSAVIAFFRNLAGSVSSTGVLTKQVAKNLVGSVSSSGAVSSLRKIFLEVAGTLSLTGSINRGISKQLYASINPSGGLSGICRVLVSVTGTVITAGIVGITVAKQLSSVLAPVGNLLSTGYQKITGALGIAVGIFLNGGLTPSGSVSGELFTYIVKALGGTISAVGSLVYSCDRIYTLAISGAVSVVGGLSRAIRKGLSGVLIPIASTTFVRRIYMFLSGVVTPIASLLKGRKARIKVRNVITVTQYTDDVIMVGSKVQTTVILGNAENIVTVSGGSYGE
jgi:hypothetical protein